METKKYIIACFLLFLSNVSPCQITEEFNKFLEDPKLTSWKEFTSSPNSKKNRELLTEYFIKNISSRSVNGKRFTEKGIDSWDIYKYNPDWKLLEKISLNPDSSVASSEKFGYNKNSVMSTIFNSKGEVDSLFQNFYNPSGSLRSCFKTY